VTPRLNRQGGREPLPTVSRWPALYWFPPCTEATRTIHFLARNSSQLRAPLAVANDSPNSPTYLSSTGKHQPATCCPTIGARASWGEMHIDADVRGQAEHQETPHREPGVRTRHRIIRRTSRGSAAGTSIRVPSGNRTHTGEIWLSTERSVRAAKFPSGELKCRTDGLAAVFCGGGRVRPSADAVGETPPARPTPPSRRRH
jgi:hypothetical protein